MARVHSMNARGEGEAKLAEVKKLMEDIEVQLQKYDSLQRWHYGHVGNLGYIAEQLDQVWRFEVGAD